MHPSYQRAMVPTWDSTIRHELDLVEEEMRDSVLSEQQLLTEISMYVIGSGGKRIRPAVTILTFKACGGTDIPKVVKIASAFEMIHAATLIHDDINDQGDYRRGRVAAYKRFGTQRALIAGDFLFVKSFKMGGTFDERIVGMVADACTAIAESEMLQSLYEGDADTPISEYLKIIEGKTAKPIEAGARVGAYLAKADEGRIDQMGGYGLAIGMAFQVIDDILDIVGNDRSLGKPRGVDFVDGKPTLPLLYAMADSEYGPEIRRLFLKPERTHQDAEEALAMVVRTKAIELCKRTALDYTIKAKAIISQVPDSEFKSSMIRLADALVERNN
jgi:octaprenyl-diphosphate synthase